MTPVEAIAAIRVFMELADLLARLLKDTETPVAEIERVADGVRIAKVKADEAMQYIA